MDLQKREGGEAEDATEEILAAACLALDKAHELLSVLVRYGAEGVTPKYLERVKGWVDGEYDPGAKRPKRCRHNWMPYGLNEGNGMMCSRCGVPRKVGVQ